MSAEMWRKALARPVNIIAALLLLAILLPVINPAPASAAEGKPVLLHLDIWTDRGGKGAGTAGGSYRVGEKPVIYVLASVSCQAKLTFKGPKGSTTSQVSLPTNQTYTVATSTLNNIDIGGWQITVEASAYNQTASDSTYISVTGTVQNPVMPQLPAVPPVSNPAPAPTTVPATTPAAAPSGSTTKIVRINASTASVLLALNALRVFEGKGEMDLRLDVNEDNAVTAEDARMILRWVVTR
jgi:hypothetical protein